MEKTQTPSDECLVSKFRRGDKNAFIILLQRHTLYIKKTIRKYTADREEASDLFQEISIHYIINSESLIKNGGCMQHGSVL